MRKIMANLVSDFMPQLLFQSPNQYKPVSRFTNNFQVKLSYKILLFFPHTLLHIIHVIASCWVRYGNIVNLKSGDYDDVLMTRVLGGGKEFEPILYPEMYTEWDIFVSVVSNH